MLNCMLHKTDKCISHVASCWVSCIRSTSMQKTTSENLVFVHVCSFKSSVSFAFPAVSLKRANCFSISIHSYIVAACMFALHMGHYVFAIMRVFIEELWCCWWGRITHVTLDVAAQSKAAIICFSAITNGVLIIWHADLYINTEVEMIKGYCRTTSVWGKVHKIYGRAVPLL